MTGQLRRINRSALVAILLATLSLLLFAAAAFMAVQSWTQEFSTAADWVMGILAVAAFVFACVAFVLVVFTLTKPETTSASRRGRSLAVAAVLVTLPVLLVCGFFGVISILSGILLELPPLKP